MNDLTLYERALFFAIHAHGNQKRRYTGQPYIVHPIHVSAMVRQSGASTAAIAAALLHDVLEDTTTTHGQLVDEFGEYVARLVYQLTDSQTPADGTRAMRKAAFAEKLTVAEPEAQTIKVCDIIDNASSVAAFDPEFAATYLPEKLAQLKVLTNADQKLLARAIEICEVNQ
jgi:(p)ppGpp synthase/HD superfamily hydrolase